MPVAVARWRGRPTQLQRPRRVYLGAFQTDVAKQGPRPAARPGEIKRAAGARPPLFQPEKHATQVIAGESGARDRTS